MSRRCQYLAKPCISCGTEFTPTSGRSRYCSAQCKRGTQTCLHCGKVFIPSRHTTGKFCSPDCWYDSKERAVNPDGTRRAKAKLPNRQCAHCGVDFHPKQTGVIYCSKICARQPQRVTKDYTHCVVCGNELPDYRRRDQRFCSRKCRTYPEGTRRQESDGYMQIKVGGQWFSEHRYVVEQQLGRSLGRYEHVHHIDGNKTNNDESNLELWKKRHPHGVRQADYHCAGCRCFMAQPRTVRVVRR